MALLSIFRIYAQSDNEKLLVNENFQSWDALASSTTEKTVTKTTDFSKETLSYKLKEIQVAPTGWDATRFNDQVASIGYLMCAKTATPYIELSPLASITRIQFIHGATGGNRGYRLWKKVGSGEWTAVTSETAYAGTASGTVVDLDINEENVALKFTNLNSAQNAYLFDLKIWGNYVSSSPQVNLTSAISPAGAGSVVNTPSGTQFDQNSQVVYTATKNFGYNFSHWQNSAGQNLSTANTYTHTAIANDEITAVFTPLNTYELIINIDGCTNDYLVACNPAPTMVEGKKMYEAGTTVTLTADSRPVMDFANWSTGSTNSNMTVAMTGDKQVTAIYSPLEYVAGWDFYNSGNNGRAADFFSTPENQAASLVLRQADGTTNSWLDKSTVAASGYEGRPGAVNWKNLTDKYYYQISFDATDFTDMSISSAMLYNYNTYSKFFVEYSLDDNAYTKIGEFSLSTEKSWLDKKFDLPAATNHAAKVYIRWIPDYTSSIVGSTSTNDGTALSGIYIFGTENTPDDGTPPVLISSVPAEDANNASATGKIVLTFDEKVKIAAGKTATLSTASGNKTLEPVVSGKTITFAYSGLDYNTAYTFTLEGNSVSDLNDNTLSSEIKINFNTLNRPAITKKAFDFVVGKDGDFKAALQSAQAAASTGKRFYVFFPDGEYNIGALTGDSNQKTQITTGNLSLIGQSMDKTVVFNKSIEEGIGITSTIQFTSASGNNYIQDLSLLNKADYNASSTGRHVVLHDQGNKSIYKNIKLLSNQDTYYTGDVRSYHENTEIHGTVDFICGGGDIFFNECLLYLENRSGNCITAAATKGDWGYVFSNCTIDGVAVNNNTYRLGRSWSNAPKTVYLNTTMKVLPTAAGWGDPMNVVPAMYAEYNSLTSAGATIDLSNRRKTYTKDATTVTLNPVLTTAQAANYTVDNVLGGSDNWQPQLYTEQAMAPVISFQNTVIPEYRGVLTWDNNDYVLCWAVFKNDVFVTFVTENHFNIGMSETSGNFTVRAANEMGGLSKKSNVYTYSPTSINNINNDVQLIQQKYYTIDGKSIASIENYQGVVIVRSVYSDGNVYTQKIINLK